MNSLIDILIGIACLVAVMVLVFILNTVWQRRHRRTRPPRHQGERQSQRGRVYKNPPPTNHNQDQWSGWP